jgi:hypothetical protein
MTSECARKGERRPGTAVLNLVLKVRGGYFDAGVIALGFGCLAMIWSLILS